MELTSIVALLAVSTLCFRHVDLIAKSGPYDLTANRFELCNDVGTDEIHFGVKMSSKGHKIKTYTNDVIFNVPWDDKLEASVEVQQLNNGAYTPKYITHTFKSCEKTWKIGKDFMQSFFGAAGYNFTKCPLPAGTYPVKDWQVNVKFNNLPSFVYGSYRFITTFAKKNKIFGCLMLYMDATPKRN